MNIAKRLTIPVMAIAAAFSIGIAYQAQDTATKPEEIVVNQPETTPEPTPVVSPEASSLPVVHDSPKTALAKSTATELVKQAAIAAPAATPTPVQPAPELAITPAPTPEPMITPKPTPDTDFYYRGGHKTTGTVAP